MRRHRSHSPSPKDKKKTSPFSPKNNFFPKAGQGIFQKAPNFTAYGNGRGRGVTLRGRTRANYSHTHSVTGATQVRATGCRRCPRRAPCVKVSGVLVSVFRTNPRVTLPNMRRYRRRSECQRERIRAGIDNVLAPHEQRHVSIFHTYDGTERTPFTFTMCSGRRRFARRARRLHNSIERQRRRQVQAASDAIDPFNFTVDLNCENP